MSGSANSLVCADRTRHSADPEVATVLREGLLCLATKPTIGRGLVRLPVARRVVRRFVAGETATQALDVLERLEGHGLQTADGFRG
jgi:hypothetical protein